MAKRNEIEKPDQERTARANRLDGEIRQEWKNSEESMMRLAGLLAQMRDEVLWTSIVNPETKEAFKRFDEYVCAVTGNKIAHTKVYDVLKVYGLTQGEAPLDPKDVAAMGLTNAAQVARLDAKDRTPEVIESAKKESTRNLKKMVQEKINAKLSPEDRKDPTFMFARNLDEPTIELIEEIEKNGIWIEAVRNGDTSVSQMVKLWNYVWATFVVDHQEELAEGEKYREAMEAAKVAEALGDNVDEGEGMPPDPSQHEAALEAMASANLGE